MKELIATLHLTAFSRFDADAHIERLTAELHALRTAIKPLLIVRGETPLALSPSWRVGELAELPPHAIEMSHTVRERHGRYYCETRIGVSGAPRVPSPDEEVTPDTVRACPSSIRH